MAVGLRARLVGLDATNFPCASLRTSSEYRWTTERGYVTAQQVKNRAVLPPSLTPALRALQLSGHLDVTTRQIIGCDEVWVALSVEGGRVDYLEHTEDGFELVRKLQRQFGPTRPVRGTAWTFIEKDDADFEIEGQADDEDLPLYAYCGRCPVQQSLLRERTCTLDLGVHETDLLNARYLWARALRTAEDADKALTPGVTDQQRRYLGMSVRVATSVNHAAQQSAGMGLSKIVSTLTQAYECPGADAQREKLVHLSHTSRDRDHVLAWIDSANAEHSMSGTWSWLLYGCRPHPHVVHDWHTARNLYPAVHGLVVAFEKYLGECDLSRTLHDTDPLWKLALALRASLTAQRSLEIYEGDM